MNRQPVIVARPHGRGAPLLSYVRTRSRRRPAIAGPEESHATSWFGGVGSTVKTPGHLALPPGPLDREQKHTILGIRCPSGRGHMPGRITFDPRDAGSREILLQHRPQPSVGGWDGGSSEDDCPRGRAVRARTTGASDPAAQHVGHVVPEIVLARRRERHARRRACEGQYGDREPACADPVVMDGCPPRDRPAERRASRLPARPPVRRA